MVPIVSRTPSPTRRSSRGSTLVEMLMASLLMALISSAVLAVIVTTNKSMAIVSDRSDVTNAAKLAYERIARDIRQARSLGDVFGQDVVDNSNSQQTYDYTIGSSTFPSANDPIYGTGAGGSQTPPGGWPKSPFPQQPWTLSNQILVAQIPIFYNNTANSSDVGNGWPTAILANQVGAGNPATPQDNVETHVYAVVPDPNNPGEFLMELVKIPGYTVYVNGGSSGTKVYDPTKVDTNPTIILSGIVGPIDPNTNLPKIFQYVDKTDSTGTPQDSPNGTYMANYTGVVMNFEVRVHKANSLHKDQDIGLKTEAFIRNNALATTTGQPFAIGGE